jgi:hypothetical protein
MNFYLDSPSFHSLEFMFEKLTSNSTFAGVNENRINYLIS